MLFTLLRYFLASLALYSVTSLFRLTPFLATDPKNRLLTPSIATLPKTPSRKSFACHTSKTPRGVVFVCLAKILISKRKVALSFIAFLLRHSSLATGFKLFIFTLLRTLFHNGALPTAFFSIVSALFSYARGCGG